LVIGASLADNKSAYHDFEFHIGSRHGPRSFIQAGKLLARHCHQHSCRESPWELLPRRARKRFAYRAKRWLNARAVEHMTAALLRERDPAGEVLGWLATIAQLLQHTP
jgi:hypothetical protein